MTTSHTTISGPGLENLDPHAVTISGLVLDDFYSPESPCDSLQNIDQLIASPGEFP